MPDPDADMASPLDAVPGLAQFAGQQADAVVITDLERRVVVWNRAAEQLYGIGPGDALGRTIDALFDSVIISQGTSSTGARETTLEHGSWRGRIADRPRFGSLVGQALVIDAVLNRIDGPDGRPIAVMSVNRDYTASDRVERELATLGTLTAATGTARSTTTFAERALEIIITTTGADRGGIMVADGDAGRLIAGQRVTSAMSSVPGIPWSQAPGVRAVTPVGRVVKGAVDRLPLTPETRRTLLEAGVRTLLLVGLHREQELMGVLALGWDADRATTPSDAVTTVIASTIARGLEQARLVEDIARRAEAERTMTTRLRALDDLARASRHVATIDELAQRSAELINTTLGAAGTVYRLIGSDGDEMATSAVAGAAPGVAAWLRDHPPGHRPALRRWRAGEGPLLEALEPGTVPMPLVDQARAAGVTARAGIPIRVAGDVAGTVTVYFDRPVAELDLDRGAFERVASIASLALENWRVRERLAASERGYRSLFEGSPDALIVERLDGTILEVNESASRIYQAEREWLLGRRSDQLAVFDADAASARSGALAPGESYAVRSTGIRRGGELFPQHVDVLRVELDGEPRLLVRVRDLTEQERLLAELIQAQKMEAIGQLVTGVAHEINNPLAAVLGFSELIRRDASLPDDLRSNADLLVEEATWTRRIAGDLLDFARRRPPERRATSLRALIDSVLALQAYGLGHGQVALELDIAEDLPDVELDRGQLQQVLINLTQNALDAIRTGGGSRLRISAWREGSPDDERVRVTVMDDGLGVAPEHVPQLFEAFFTTKPPGEGTGLGLPVSAGIVRSHRGHLGYATASWGRGAAFTFDMPVHADPSDAGVVQPSARSRAAPTAGGPSAPSAPDAAAGPGPGPSATKPARAIGAAVPPDAVAADRAADAPGAAADGSRPRVLVLDDEPSIRVFLEKALIGLAYEPFVTGSPDEAVSVAGSGDFAAVLCDFQLKRLSGIEVFERIVSDRPELAERFVMMSGDVLNARLAAFALQRGVTLLSKPFDLATLDRTVRAVLERDAQPRG